MPSIMDLQRLRGLRAKSGKGEEKTRLIAKLKSEITQKDLEVIASIARNLDDDLDILERKFKGIKTFGELKKFRRRRMAKILLELDKILIHPP